MVLCITTDPALAEVYQWKDDNGNPVFGDQPPKDKTSTAVSIKNTENTGAQFASPNQTKDIERNTTTRKHATQLTTARIDAHCRSYLSQLNKVEIFLGHTNSPRDQHKAQDLRTLIKKECGNALLTQKFDDSRCQQYRRDLSQTEIFLEHTSTRRDQQKVKDLRQQIARECR